MGRGRQKAKQTKVARQLKYFSPNTDYDALQRELTAGEREAAYAAGALEEVDEVEDDEADDEDDDEYADWSPGQSR